MVERCAAQVFGRAARPPRIRPRLLASPVRRSTDPAVVSTLFATPGYRRPVGPTRPAGHQTGSQLVGSRRRVAGRRRRRCRPSVGQLLGAVGRLHQSRAGVGQSGQHGGGGLPDARIDLADHLAGVLSAVVARWLVRAVEREPGTWPVGRPEGETTSALKSIRQCRRVEKVPSATRPAASADTSCGRAPTSTAPPRPRVTGAPASRRQRTPVDVHQPTGTLLTSARPVPECHRPHRSIPGSGSSTTVISRPAAAFRASTADRFPGTCRASTTALLLFCPGRPGRCSETTSWAALPGARRR